MIAILASLLLFAPQEDDSKRARDAALGLPGLAQSAPAPPPPADPGPTATFMAPRLKRTVEDYQGLLDHNVFSPRKKEATKEKPAAEGPKTPEGPRVRKWVLTGIVFNPADQRYEALIEVSAPRESKFCKTGDTIAGATISEVTADQVSYVKDESPGILKLTDSLSETVAGGAPAPAKPEDEGDVEKARERMKKRHKRESVPDEAEDDAGRKNPK